MSTAFPGCALKLHPELRGADSGPKGRIAPCRRFGSVCFMTATPWTLPGMWSRTGQRPSVRRCTTRCRQALKATIRGRSLPGDRNQLWSSRGKAYAAGPGWTGPETANWLPGALTGNRRLWDNPRRGNADGLRLPVGRRCHQTWRVQLTGLLLTRTCAAGGRNLEPWARRTDKRTRTP